MILSVPLPSASPGAQACGCALGLAQPPPSAIPSKRTLPLPRAHSGHTPPCGTTKRQHHLSHGTPSLDQRSPISQELRLRVHRAEPETSHGSPHCLELRESLPNPAFCATDGQPLHPSPPRGLTPPAPHPTPTQWNQEVARPLRVAWPAGWNAVPRSIWILGRGPTWPPAVQARGLLPTPVCGAAACPCLLPVGSRASQAHGATLQHELASRRNAAFDAQTGRRKEPAPHGVTRRQLGP